MSIIACSVDGCEKLTGAKGTARGFCSKHYNRWLRNGDPLALNPKKVTYLCSVAGCEKPHDAKGLCTAHITNFRRHGDVSPRKRGEIVDGKKICSTCAVDLPIDRFSRRGDLRQSKCKECEYAYRSARYYADHEKQKSIGRDGSKKYAANRRDAARRRRALTKGATVEHVESVAIFERDGWLCGICSSLIPKDAKWPSPLSASIDHIIPLSLGGEHSYKNIQSSHLVCNMRKGAKAA